MAATKKAIEIRDAKAKVVEEIRVVRSDIVSACGRVPSWVASADAIKSVEWRDLAEAELVRCTTHPAVSIDSNTLEKLRDILAKDRGAMGRLS